MFIIVDETMDIVYTIITNKLWNIVARKLTWYRSPLYMLEVNSPTPTSSRKISM